MMLGNLLQQIYNLADTLIAGRALGRDALAAIGSAYTLMTFLTSIFIGLSLGAGALFSIYFGKREQEKLQSACLLYTSPGAGWPSCACPMVPQQV